MGTLRTVALFVLSISFVTFVAFFGRLPIFRNTPIGFLHRLIWIRIPTLLWRIDSLVSGGRFSSSLAAAGRYLWNDQHPLVLIFFLGLVTLSAGAFVPSVWSKISIVHKLLIVILLPLPYIFTFLCTYSKTQLINWYNHAENMRHFPFDHILFHHGQICSTCNFEKPARSKHCSICKSCIARNDHHCIWVNACLGRGNYKHFLYLLLSTTLMILYGAYLAYIVLKPEIDDHFARFPAYHKSQLPNDPSGFLDSILYRLTKFSDILGTGLEAGGLSVGGVGFLAALTWPLPLGLLGYHIYLIWAGMTTNESSKWQDWRDDMYDGVIFKAPLNPNADKSDSALFSPWPVRSKQILIRTKDGQPPRHMPSVVQEIVDGDVHWDRCWRLSEVENIYDIGFWYNLLEVLRN